MSRADRAFVDCMSGLAPERILIGRYSLDVRDALTQWVLGCMDTETAQGEWFSVTEEIEALRGELREAAEDLYQALREPGGWAGLPDAYDVACRARDDA